MTAQNPIDVLWERLGSADPAEVKARACAAYDASHNVFAVPLLDEEVRVDATARRVEGPNGPADFGTSLVCVQYLLTARNEPPAGEWVNPRALPHGDFFFRGPHDLPADKLVAAFGDEVDLFRSAAAALGGRALDIADAACEFRALPRVPVAIALWGADDEFPARAQFLFDSTAADHLPLDVLWLLGGMLAEAHGQRLPDRIGDGGRHIDLTIGVPFPFRLTADFGVPVEEPP